MFNNRHFDVAVELTPQCPQGHVYTIGDVRLAHLCLFYAQKLPADSQCGQAVVESTCLECGAPIGGSSHTLRGDNTRDAQMDALSRGAENPHVPAQ